jgi:hypothetical protein
VVLQFIYIYIYIYIKEAVYFCFLCALFCVRGSVLLILICNCAGDKIEKNDMGGACSTDGGGEACVGFWWGNLRETDHWGDPGVGGRIILGRILRKLDVGVRTGLGWLRIVTIGEQL